MALDMSKINQARAALAEKMSKGSFDAGPKWWKPLAKNKIRIMPGWDNEGEFAGQFWREVHQHWNVAEKSPPIICTEKTPGLGDPCPVCEFVDELRAQKTNVEAQETVKNLRAKTAYLLNIIDLNDATYTAKDVAEFTQEKPDKEVPFEVGDPKIQVYAAPSTVFNAILGVIQENGVDITDPSEGYDLTLTKNGTGLTTKYEITPMLKASACKYYKEGETKLPDLGKIGFVKKHDELVALLAGRSDSTKLLGSGKANQDRDDDDELPAPKVETKKAAKPANDDTDDMAARLKAALGG